jgi:hypothetical protein
MHSVGCGKTCSAIAIGSSSFEKDGWTIVYVTRHTLKADVWKNMFGQTCSIIIREMIEKGMPIPEAESKRKKLIKAWMEPMSYKQFSNALLGKNAFGEELIKRNGKKDVLQKTLVIIDEAHKLHAPDVSGGEKPDVEAIKKAFMHSYKSSGKNSGKLLLMTATPYTDDPMDMMKLLNLMRPKEDQLPESFEQFQSSYLDQNGTFTKEGKVKFLEDIAGYVSYLNRERDARSFAYPIIEDINVPLSEYEFKADLDSYIKAHKDVKHEKLNLDLLKMDLSRDKVNYELELKKDMNNNMQSHRTKLTECVQNHLTFLKEKTKELTERKALESVECNKMLNKCKTDVKEKYAAKTKIIEKDIKEETEGCKEKVNECKSRVNEDTKDEINKLKQIAKEATKKCKKDIECKEAIKTQLDIDIMELKESSKEKIAECKGEEDKCKADLKEKSKKLKENLKSDLDFDTKECDNDPIFKDCIDKVTKDYIHQKTLLEQNNPCTVQKEQLVKYEELQKQIIKDKVVEFVNKKRIELDVLNNNYEEKHKVWKDLYNRIVNTARNDKSQQLRLETCIKTKKVLPIYQQILKGQIPDYIEDDGVTEKEDIPKNLSANIYIINGHGSEDIKDFSKRETLPDDKVLVVFPICGKANYLNIICMFMDIFNDPKYIKWMMDPLKYQSKIEDKLGYPIRIFLPGDKVPSMSTNLFFDFEYPAKTVIAKSGVFEVTNVPSINRNKFEGTTDMKYSLGHRSCFQYSGLIDDATRYTKQIHNEVFSGNKYDKAEVVEGFNKLRHRNFKVMDILKAVGPGIYFYTGCRSAFNNVPDNVYEKILLQSASQQEDAKRSPKMNKFRQHLKVEDKGKEIINSANDGTNKSKEKEDENSSNTKPLSDKDKMKLEKEHKKKVLNIKKEIKNILAKLVTYDDKQIALAKKQIEDWNKEIKEPMKELQHLSEILAYNVEYKSVLKFTKSKKQIVVQIMRVYKIEKTSYNVPEKLVGVIPDKFKLVEQKCDTNTFIKKLKQLYKKHNLNNLTLPLNLADWNDERSIELCNAIKNV